MVASAHISARTQAVTRATQATQATTRSTRAMPTRRWTSQATLPSIAASFTRAHHSPFVSPQKLAGDGEAIVLDFPHKEMRAVKRGTSLGTLGIALTLDPVALCEDKDSPIQGLAYVLSGTIDGETVKLLVDTGAHHSDLLMSSPPGVKLLPRAVDSKEQVYAASGKVTPKTLKDVQVAVGAVEGKFDVDLIPGKKDEFCPRDGVLAMDILAKCELLLEPGRFLGQCH